MTATPTAETPLLLIVIAPSEKEFPESILGTSLATSNKNNYNGEHDLHFYNPATILDISREVAFAYLILLTGGAVEYVAPTLAEGGMAPSSSMQQHEQLLRKNLQPPVRTAGRNDEPSSLRPVPDQGGSEIATTTLNDESASLAYAAIVDGNVLHACFGLKVTPNGRMHNTNSPKNVGSDGGGDTNQRSYSIFCCFPRGGASSTTLDALQSVLSNLSSNRVKMQNLVEILREVRELHIESSLGDAGTRALYTAAKEPLHLQVIHAYVHCFTAIVRFHDSKRIILGTDASFSSCCTGGSGGGVKKKNARVNICSKFFKKIHLLPKPKINNPRLEKLRADTLRDIGKGFQGLKDDIWESMERMATETSFTGASLEESTSGEPRG